MTGTKGNGGRRPYIAPPTVTGRDRCRAAPSAGTSPQARLGLHTVEICAFTPQVARSTVTAISRLIRMPMDLSPSARMDKMTGSLVADGVYLPGEGG